MDKYVEFHFVEKQKAFYRKEVKPLRMISTVTPLGWVAIDGVCYVCIGFGGVITQGILLPVKETEEFLKAEYKRVFDIIIPEDKHQYPYSKD